MALALDIATRVGALDLEASLTVEPGECLALAGASGAGKTTVLRSVAGLHRPDRGRVRLGDATWLDTATGTTLPPEARRCGYVFQHHALFGHLSAWRNVAYPLRRLPRRERRGRAVELLARLGLERRADARPAELSGGERQRVALARALARQPAVLLLDEPLAALDPRTRADATRTLAGVIAELGAATILVTHDFAEAVRLGDRVAAIDRGRIVQQGAPGELASRPASAFVADFTGAVVLTGVARPGDDGLTLVDLDGGGTIVSTDPASGPVAATVHPWEVAIDAPGTTPPGSARNHLDAEVVAVTELGNRVRLGLAAPQPLAAELTAASAAGLGLRPGARVTASWKAAGTRLVAR